MTVYFFLLFSPSSHSCDSSSPSSWQAVAIAVAAADVVGKSRGAQPAAAKTGAVVVGLVGVVGAT